MSETSLCDKELVTINMAKKKSPTKGVKEKVSVFPEDGKIVSDGIDKTQHGNSDSIVDKIYRLRRKFVIIGLTGRTGSGCTTVARILSKRFNELKSSYRDFHSGHIDNNTRKDRIVYHYLKENWDTPFTIITASDVIFYFALTLSFDDFIGAIVDANIEKNTEDRKDKIDKQKEQLSNIQDAFDSMSKRCKSIDCLLESPNSKFEEEQINDLKELLCKDIKGFRGLLEKQLETPTILATGLQKWGDNVRLYNSVVEKDTITEKAPSCLAHKIDQMIQALHQWNEKNGDPTMIVIDALRNPFEVLYFRESYSAFYLMSVNTTEDIRHQKLFEKGLRKDEIERIDKGENTSNDENKSEVENRYQFIDIDACNANSDIFLTHDGTPEERNYKLVNQIFTYLALIFHPGIVPPSPLERVMQVAYTAKLNSGCLSRQVGAAVTNDSFSVQSIGWNTVAEGQTPCSIRCLCDLYKKEDDMAFSRYEREDEGFQGFISKMINKYDEVHSTDKLNGLTLTYCFKDVYTTLNEKQKGNQVHTRSLHAEENAFLQLAKYGNQGIKGGKLFTTASCCELCAKKAYQLGIKEIYYIDAYPGITQRHILECGTQQPKMILFHGAIGRAYLNLYNPIIPLKDEIETLTGIRVKNILKDNTQGPSAEIKTDKNNGDNNKDKESSSTGG